MAKGESSARESNEAVSVSGAPFFFWQAVQRLDVPVLSLGKVTAGKIAVDDEDWGTIEQWKQLYDTAIENHLSKELDSEEALAMI